MADILSTGDKTEAIYIAGEICADSTRFDVATLRRVAQIVDPEHASETKGLSRDKLCRWLAKRAPYTWTSYRVNRGLTGLASSLKLTASSILKSIRNRLNVLINGNRILRAVYDSKDFEDFKKRLEAPPKESARVLRRAADKLKDILRELHALAQAENKFTLLSVFRRAAWFGRLSPEEQRTVEVLTRTVTRILNDVQAYAIQESALTETAPGTALDSVGEEVRSLRERIQKLELALVSKGIVV